MTEQDRKVIEILGRGCESALWIADKARQQGDADAVAKLTRSAEDAARTAFHVACQSA